ncbi:DNA/RNA non-specific endonuclease [Motilimonas eburnea]|uniref:DNA/RNA non-specific endonuclease n=1 Tax=Motilimonas eburnea TaxID=1737488 RepID=UPI001E4B6663|nr:DNA/RNA non-specific endonuclease [Motilimonas eburnea]MCE2570618.1 DNA/RNA non-specific endonuclease [Motilimonas eburnea]
MRKPYLSTCLLLVIAGCQGGTSSLQTSQPSATIGAIGCEHALVGHQSDLSLCREGYQVGFNLTHRTADWVSYQLTPERVIGYDEGYDFIPDLDLPSSAQVDPSLYLATGYDRGHLAPAASMDFTSTSAQQSYLMSNIVPQLPEFNRQGWADLEAWERQCTLELGHLMVITGPIYQPSDQRWLAHQVRIPSAYFKAYASPINQQTTMAFVIPHQGFQLNEIDQYQVSLAQLERVTKLRLFPERGLNKHERGSLCHLNGDNTSTSTALTCEDKRYCNQMQSCQEAQFYLNTCGLSRLDNDNDGIACESLCY